MASEFRISCDCPCHIVCARGRRRRSRHRSSSRTHGRVQCRSGRRPVAACAADRRTCGHAVTLPDLTRFVTAAVPSGRVRPNATTAFAAIAVLQCPLPDTMAECSFLRDAHGNIMTDFSGRIIMMRKLPVVKREMTSNVDDAPETVPGVPEPSPASLTPSPEAPVASSAAPVASSAPAPSPAALAQPWM